VKHRILLLLCSLAAALASARPSAIGGALFDANALNDVMRREAQRLVALYAPPRVATPPAWAVRQDRPLATIAVLADLHYDDADRAAWTKLSRERLLKVVRYLNESLKPQRVLLLGDIIAFHQAEQLRHVKELLDKRLAAPYCAVWGNHDGPGFEAVFGQANRGLTVGGVRLIALGMNYGHWDSGWGSYDRLDWLAGELAAHRDEPTLILTHNPVALPTFENNAAVLRLLDAQPQVLGVLAGHMHVDYEMRVAKAHLGMPMFAREPHAFKVLSVHPDAILIFTYEDAGDGYRQVGIYQKIDVPHALRPTPRAGGP